MAVTWGTVAVSRLARAHRFLSCPVLLLLAGFWCSDHGYEAFGFSAGLGGYHGDDCCFGEGRDTLSCQRVWFAGRSWRITGCLVMVTLQDWAAATCDDCIICGEKAFVSGKNSAERMGFVAPEGINSRY